jgi:tetratricopeptide (TPR) repeat protein
MAAGKDRDSERSLSRALTLEPSLTGARLLRAAAILHRQCMRRENHLLPHCLADLDRVLAEAPADPRALRLRAELKNDFQDFEGACEDLRRIIDLDARDDWARAELADILCDAGRFEEAWPLLDGLRRRGRGQGWYWALRGRAVALSGRIPEGVDCLWKAAKLLPRSGIILAWIGEAYRRVGRYSDALAAFNRAIKLDPLFVYSYEWRGRLLLMLGRPGEALPDIDRFVRTDPRHRYGPSLRGEALFKLGRYSQAARDFDRVPMMDQRSTWNPQVREGELATYRRRESSLWEDLAAALRRSPKNSVLWTLSGRFKNTAGLKSEALKDLSRAIGLSSSPARRAQALSWRGRTILDSGAPARALRDLDAALNLAPSDRRARAWRAEALTRLGKTEEALRNYAFALDRPKPELAFAFIARGRLHGLAGRWDLAQDDFSKAFALDIRSAAARQGWLEARLRNAAHF